MKQVTILMFLALAALPAFAAQDGNGLLNGCKVSLDLTDKVPRTSLTTKDIMDAGYCAGVVHAVAGMAHTSGYLPDSHLDNTRQDIRVVEKYLYDNPESLSEPDYILVLKALLKAYPCGNKIAGCR